MQTKILKISRKVGLVDMFKELGFKVGVEVGTDRGGYARDICSRYPELKLYTMDPYQPYNEGSEVKDINKMIEIESEARETLLKYPNCVFLAGTTSMQTVKRFQDDSIDFVFIDGNHEYEHVYEDIVEWTKKVKPGGIVAGHDYVENESRKYGVIEAVNKYVEENNIDPLYILRKGSFVDCWMFIKP